MIPQEINEKVRLGCLGTEVDVGNEQRPEMSYGVVLRRRHHTSLVLIEPSEARQNQTRVSGR
ncbi:hypothetical protein D3C87_2156860 [compost metagenome]